jgi:hypothetical protein
MTGRDGNVLSGGMNRRAWLLLLTGIGAVAASVVISLFSPVIEHWRTSSPDGEFVAIAHTQPIFAIIGVMPGQGSDKPGRVTVYRGNQSCGSARVPMVAFVYELRWELDTNPRRAEIPLAATWNLDDCSIERLFGG